MAALSINISFTPLYFGQNFTDWISCSLGEKMIPLGFLSSKRQPFFSELISLILLQHGLLCIIKNSHSIIYKVWRIIIWGCMSGNWSNKKKCFGFFFAHITLLATMHAFCCQLGAWKQWGDVFSSLWETKRWSKFIIVIALGLQIHDPTKTWSFNMKWTS